MIPLTTTAKNAIEQNTSVTYGTSLVFEYNMNSMVDGITVTGATITRQILLAPHTLRLKNYSLSILLLNHLDQ